ncbi:MAG: Cna B-type domain-containing protein, partial [Oscillospiraceae bacterium]|nr:Cna B-type domain-containing protein [Oscillospiraceae bacterium]
MKNIIRRGLAWVLVLCMVFSLVPGAAMPVRAEEGAPTVNGEYTDGAWNQGGSGTVTYNVDGTDVTLSKTAQAVEGMENTYDVTLTVKTSTSSSVRTNSGAVVLVIDTSSSMQSCANCGSRTGHASGCTDRSQNRLQAAKVAAREFLSSYAGSDANATRMLAIVTFDGGYRTNMSWSNVAGGSGSNSYDSALSTINGLSYATGTNMEGGLKLALDLLGSSAVSGFGSMNVVLLSDGAPSQRIGNSDLYGSNKADCDAAANQAAAIRATGSKLYTVCFGAARDNAYDDVTVSSFLSGRIASSGCAYDADNASQLNAAFRAITESITSGLSGKGWTVTDPMAPHISVSGGTGDSFYKDGAHYTWELSNVSTQTEGNTTYYIYTYTYRVTFDPQFEGFVEGDYYPTNEETYLNIEGKQYEFPVPGVKARLPRRDVTVTKVWNDEGNQDGIRPTSVTVQLMEGERAIGEPVVLNADNGWSYTWDGETYNLIYKSEGKVHVYTVVELDTHKEYTASATFEDSRITLTNTHEVYRKDITVTKKWDDKNNQDGIRPKAITVNLLANGTVVATAELTAPDWSYTFRGFEVNEDGREITYTVEEVNVPEGYTASVDGLTVTNKHEVEKTSVSVKKIWDDNDNQDGLRPNDVTFRLLANGVDTGKTLVITGSSWTGTFTDL